MLTINLPMQCLKLVILTGTFIAIKRAVHQCTHIKQTIHIATIYVLCAFISILSGSTVFVRKLNNNILQYIVANCVNGLHMLYIQLTIMCSFLSSFPLAPLQCLQGSLLELIVGFTKQHVFFSLVTINESYNQTLQVFSLEILKTMQLASYQVFYWNGASYYMLQPCMYQ